MLDGEPVNINPVIEVENSEIKFFGIIGIFDCKFFGNEFDLKQYLATHSSEKLFSSSCIIEYIRNFAGRTDVIAITGVGNKSKTKYYCAIDEEGYAEYNSERSIYKGKYVWEYNNGSYLVPMYDELRRRGINFENDVYEK